MSKHAGPLWYNQQTASQLPASRNVWKRLSQPCVEVASQSVSACTHYLQQSSFQQDFILRSQPLHLLILRLPFRLVLSELVTQPEYQYSPLYSCTRQGQLPLHGSTRRQCFTFEEPHNVLPTSFTDHPQPSTRFNMLSRNVSILVSLPAWVSLHRCFFIFTVSIALKAHEKRQLCFFSNLITFRKS